MRLLSLLPSARPRRLRRWLVAMAATLLGPVIAPVRSPCWMLPYRPGTLPWDAIEAPLALNREARRALDREARRR